MAHLRKNFSVAVLLIVIVAAVAGTSGSYHGLCCWTLDNNVDCDDLCLEESSNNIHGECFWFKCYCYTGH
ncbi:hypothetical protein BDA96_04G079300 [Sorghum bicolor]|uniref:Knottin scorpion toxin-like domain-containing protein n=1 Tax=Sorghum bicolor TaxID=4558 RepID=A0A921R1B9_SORBI|nr:hypothetical protein BDA96_04G079300 [Sorghum bicolor]